MVNVKNKGYVSPIAVHPGETVREALEYVGMTQTDLSARSQISEKTISLILSGQQPVTPETALKLERVLGLSYDLLVGMQSQYEADKFRIDEKERLAEEVKYLPKFSCYSELVKLDYVKQTRSKPEKVEELLNFFEVNSLTSVENVFEFAYRISTNNEIDHGSLAAWLHIGTIESKKREVQDFDRSILLQNIVKMRSLTTENARVYSQALIDLCAEAGVVLVYTPHLKRTCVNGAARWLTPNKALVQLSIYYRYADIFWFTLFHELGHILKHGKTESFVDLVEQQSSTMEKEADLFAREVLIPKNMEEEFQKLKSELKPDNVKEKIIEFSSRIDIDTGIIAGRVAKEMNIWPYISSLRKKLNFS